MNCSNTVCYFVFMLQPQTDVCITSDVCRTHHPLCFTCIVHDGIDADGEKLQWGALQRYSAAAAASSAVRWSVTIDTRDWRWVTTRCVLCGAATDKNVTLASWTGTCCCSGVLVVMACMSKHTAFLFSPEIIADMNVR